MLRLLWILALAGAIAGLASAQTFARLAGVVHDRSGSTIAAANLTIRSTQTGLQRATVSAQDGSFVFADLPPATYTLRAERNGFRPLVRGDIELTVGSSVTADLVLEVGSLDQALTVTDRPSMVNTQTADLSFLASSRQMEQLPLNGRNYTDLALLQPGVVAYPNRDFGSVVAHGLAMSMNGQDPRSNAYLLDGTIQNDFTNGPAGSAASTALGLEGVREFRIELNAYSAQFGRNSGGQVNVLTKSGGNDVHGSLFYFLRNDNFDARNFFDPSKKPEFQRNQFGGSVGGPLRKQKTFYFFTGEALRENLGRTVSTVVPNAAARNGVLPDPNNPGATITIPVNPAVVPYLNEYPMPNGADLGGGIAVYKFDFPQTLREYFVQGRLDHYFSATNQLFARYTYDDAEQLLPTDYPQFPRAFASRNQFATIEDHWVQSPTTTHTFRASFSRTPIGQNAQANTATPLQPFVPGRDMVGNIDIGGFPRWGTQTSVSVHLTQNVYGGEYGLARSFGRHMLKIGALGEHIQDNMVNPTFSLGVYTFTDLQSFLRGNAQRFLGLPPGGPFDRYWRFNLFGFYLQDDFRIHPRFVVNLGVRYEFATLPAEKYGRDAALPNLYQATPTVGPLYVNPTWLNITPRFGFSWDVLGNGKLAIRGGYGMFYNTNNQQHLIVTVTNPPFTPRVSINNPRFPQPDFALGIGNSMRPVQYNIQSPRVQVYNALAEWQVPWEILITAGYAGSLGTHLWRSGDWNIVEPTRLPDGTLFFPVGGRRRNPNFGVIELKSGDGNSWYNAGIFEVRKRFSKGVLFQSAYTFSRNIDTTQASTFFSDATNGTTSAFPEFPGFNYNKGLADYHAKHNWVLNFLWQIPGPKGGVKGALLGGWQWSGIYSMRSGNPLTLFEQRNRSRSLWQPSIQSGMGFDRPSMAPGYTYESAVIGKPSQWFDPKAFVLQPAGQLGTMGRGALIGPDMRSLDTAIMKSFPLHFLSESSILQFRAEGFNIANRANFGPPSLTAFAGDRDGEAPLSSLGLVRNTVTTSRQIQFGLRLQF